jgi:hypothetical protein
VVLGVAGTVVAGILPERAQSAFCELQTFVAASVLKIPRGAQLFLSVSDLCWQRVWQTIESKFETL